MDVKPKETKRSVCTTMEISKKESLISIAAKNKVSLSALIYQILNDFLLDKSE